MRLCVLSVLWALALSGQEIERLDRNRLTPPTVDRIVESRMRASRVRRLALALLNRIEVGYVKA